MKLNINFIYSFFILLLVSFVVLEFHNNNVLENRINTITKYSKSLDSEKTFKEDYYITQQSHDTNLILVVFTVLIAFTGLFTYVNIIERYNSKVNEIKDEIEKYKSEWDKQHNKLSKLELDLYFQIAVNYDEKAKKHEKENDFKSYINISMCALEKYAQVIKVSDNDIYKQRILNLLNSRVDYDYTLLKDIENVFEISNLDYTLYKIRVTTISEVLDSKHLQMFNIILSKIQIL